MAWFLVVFVCIHAAWPAVDSDHHGFEGNRARQRELDCQRSFEILSACKRSYWGQLKMHS